MEKNRKTGRTAVLMCALLASMSCSDFLGGGDGEIGWRFDRDVYSWTKAAGEIPDTNDFYLEVADAKGKLLYSGTYGKSPETMTVSAGSYTVSVRSSDFDKPAFSAPQYGDTQVVVVKAGERASVRLSCRMINAGIRLNINSSFLNAYPKGALYLRSDAGKLLYGYSEKRIAYFQPGSVSLLLDDGQQEEALFSRKLEAQQVLTLGISAASGGKGSGEGLSVAITVDTLKTWLYDNYVIGGGNGGGGGQAEDAMDVATARESVGSKDVWVYGYIVGGDLSSNGATVRNVAPFSKKTHIAIASRASTTAKSSCIAVELPAGKVRDALNLVDHPGLLGSTVYVKGDIVQAYFNTVGLKSTSDCKVQ